MTDTPKTIEEAGDDYYLKTQNPYWMNRTSVTGAFREGAKWVYERAASNSFMRGDDTYHIPISNLKKICGVA